MKCDKWLPNTEAFGCKQKKRIGKKENIDSFKAQELELLCKNVYINAGGNYPPYSFVFRGGKYWKFDNLPKPGKPLGNLVEGQVWAEDNWPGIELPTGVSHLNDDFITVGRSSWSLWTPDKREKPTKKKVTALSAVITTTTELPEEEELDEAIARKKKPNDTQTIGAKDKPKFENIIKNRPINEPEVGDEPDGESEAMGAIFNDDPNPNVRTHVKGDQVCNLLFINDKLYLNGKCVAIEEDKREYPADIVAAIKPEDGDWYFINNDGKYCKRNDKVFEKVLYNL